MKIRLAQPADLPILLKFEQCVIAEERPFNNSIRTENVKYYDLEYLLDDSNTSLQLVEDNGRVVGCGYVQLRPSQSVFVHDRHAYMGFMYVESDSRGQRINKMIIESLISWGKSQGVDDFYLDVYAGNQAAIRAYEKVGLQAELIGMKLSLSEK